MPKSVSAGSANSAFTYNDHFDIIATILTVPGPDYNKISRIFLNSIVNTTINETMQRKFMFDAGQELQYDKT
jgi:hypothetical protein